MKLTPSSDKGESPVTSFVQLERYNAIRLVQHVHGSLAALSKVIKGTTLLTAETQSLATSLMKQEVSNALSQWSFIIITFDQLVAKPTRPFGHAMQIFTYLETVKL